MKNNLYVFFLFFITGLMSCSHHSGLYEHAEKIMSQHPDSVLINPAKRNVMVVKNEMRLLKQKRNVLQI